MSGESEDNVSTPNSSENSDDTLGSNDSFGTVELLAVTQVVLPNFQSRIPGVPRNTSRLPGNDWMGEIMCGTPERFFDNVRMKKRIFMALVHELTSRDLLPSTHQSRVSVYEEVALFMRTVGMHLRQRDSMERFQHSLETINRHIDRVVMALNILAPVFIKRPNFNEVPPQVGDNPHFYPFLEGAIGTMDGTLIPAHVPRGRQHAYRSRKGHISQNVLAICDFDLMFTYVYAGWEGSASDAHVLLDAIQNDENFPWPPQGKYYLVDAGFTNYACFLAPYRQQRYHLQEFNSGGRQPQTPKELFNYRHAQLRNTVERCFGILKSRFPILKWEMPCYTTPHQVQLVIACCVIHNFIRIHDRDDHLFDPNCPDVDEDNEVFSLRVNPNQAEVHAQGQFRDAIANAMWEDRKA